MADYSETTRQSWLSRLTSSVAGVLFGFALVAGSGIALFWNEGRTVKQASALAEGESVVITVPGDKVDAANQDRLVHVSEIVSTQETLNDEQFAVSAPVGAVKLERNVEMYQWKEDKRTKTEKNTGGSSSSTTTYTYEKTWSSKRINSSNFKRSGHSNPSSWPADSSFFIATQAKLGAFDFGMNLVNRLSETTPVALSAAEVKLDGLGGPGHVEGNTIYVGANPNSPQIGDVRISFTAIPKGDASVVGRQVGQGFQEFMTKVKVPLLLVSSGNKTSEVMFSEAKTLNTLISWAFRVGGFVAMWVGFGLIMRPLSVLADVLPFVGNIVGTGTSLVAGVLAFTLSVVVIAIGWIASRPIVGIGLLVLAVAAIVLLVMRNNKKKRQQLPPAYDAGPPAMPPPLNL